MKAYLINLARSKERLAAADAQLHAAGVAYERVEAVDGRAFGWRGLRKRVRRWRFFLVCGHFPRVGEVACALSHGLAWGRLAASGAEAALVLEDDVALDAAALREALAVVGARLAPSRAEVFLLNNPSGAKPPEGGRGAIPAGETVYAEAYVVSAAAARRMARLNDPVRMPIDSWGIWARRGVAVWRVFPTACGQTGAPSEICRAASAKRRARWGWYVALWRARVALGRAVDGLVYRVTGR